MKEDVDKSIDNLFAKIRLQLLQVRQSDPATAEEIKNLLTQLEDWVESLVVDSLKLKSLESRPKAVTKSPSKRQQRLSSK